MRILELRVEMKNAGGYFAYSIPKFSSTGISLCKTQSPPRGNCIIKTTRGLKPPSFSQWSPKRANRYATFTQLRNHNILINKNNTLGHVVYSVLTKIRELNLQLTPLKGATSVNQTSSTDWQMDAWLYNVINIMIREVYYYS